MNVDRSLSARVASCFEDARDVLGQDAIKEVTHFLKNGEYEMAFEGLVLELIATGGIPTGFVANAWESLGRELGLQQESVFDGEFWSKFGEWRAQVELE